ncbi:hypothetical protein PSEUDO8O_120421 [Pseudomonas sp. 8O]|nr:hypothetical protein PSEUDO8O_120421 [Pseudomonas sp. 8O]
MLEKAAFLPDCTLFLDTSEPASRFRELERYNTDGGPAKTSEDRSESRSTLQVVNEQHSLRSPSGLRLSALAASGFRPGWRSSLFLTQ